MLLGKGVFICMWPEVGSLESAVAGLMRRTERTGEAMVTHGVRASSFPFVITSYVFYGFSPAFKYFLQELFTPKGIYLLPSYFRVNSEYRC